MTEKTDRNLVPALARATEIFDFIASSEEGATFPEINLALDIPRSSIFRILMTLQELGYITQEKASGAFFLGPKLSFLAKAVKRKFNLIDICDPYMKKLSLEIGETVKLSVLQNYEVVVIHKVNSPGHLKLTVAVGSKLPLHAGGASKILLSSLTEKEIDQLLEGKLKQYTSNTLIDPEQLQEKMKEIPLKGYAEDLEEYMDGIRAIAFPLTDRKGKIIAALSIPYLATPANIEKIISALDKINVYTQQISNAIALDYSHN